MKGFEWLKNSFVFKVFPWSYPSNTTSLDTQTIAHHQNSKQLHIGTIYKVELEDEKVTDVLGQFSDAFPTAAASEV